MSISTNSQFQVLPSEVENKIRLISTRGAEFDSMTINEQLQNLNNLIENILKPDQKGKYLIINYDEVFFKFISEADVKQYRKRTQAFRHATEATLKERVVMNENEKKLLVHLGTFIAIHLYNHVNNRIKV